MSSRKNALQTPGGKKKVLLHSCCAPCAAEIMELLCFSKIDYTVFFYNPNIHPKREYEMRKQENIRFCEKLGVPFVDGDYDVKNWFEKAKGMEFEPERGKRCTMCFDMRFEVSAQYAHKNDFPIFSSTLSISRWKNKEQIDSCGHRAAKRHPQLEFWSYNWRKDGGSERMYEISKKESFYQQQYCGCIYSLRDSNKWRIKKGRKPIKIGETFYEEKIKDS